MGHKGIIESVQYLSGSQMYSSDRAVELRFLAAGDLSRLAKLLRILGIDCLYSGGLSLPSAILLAVTEDRILLTKVPVAETSRLRVARLIDDSVEDQLRFILNEYNLAASLKPFSRCLKCNELLVPKNLTDFEGVPESVIQRRLDIHSCPGCGRSYWEGSHVERMRERLIKLTRS
jgi:uncharacterized protein with PIN domain